ncbi:hypothetical protein K8P10_000725 [Leucobacter sp. Psy1]|uniref:PACE efflux transporter n=1 Tax=Leucobacter sp. Psy1 TaxID=2875729 RepID=UPI001CD1DB3F|nr:PACE efflux transporter [Leucobacter sp. Psy1]UBH05214.1 hypothetical protein K8P10_000725 [Leucobacter sp. Psy1]
MTFAGHTRGASAPASTSISTTVTAAVDLRATNRQRYFDTRPVLRRVVYVAGYEGLSVLFTVVVLSALLGHGGGQSTVTAILVSTTATLWNYVWNTIFEAIERRTGAKGRGVRARAVHAIGYEGGVLLFTIPLVAFMLGVSLLEAFAIEGGLLVFFLVFTLIYTWVFDRLFGLPASARK